MSLSEVSTFLLSHWTDGNPTSIASWFGLRVITQVFIAASFLTLAIYTHERAHQNELRKYGIDSLVQTTKKKFWRMEYYISWPKNALTHQQENDVYFAGIYYGLFIILFLMWINLSLFLITLIIYLVGCKHDMVALWKNIPVES